MECCHELFVADAASTLGHVAGFAAGAVGEILMQVLPQWLLLALMLCPLKLAAGPLLDAHGPMLCLLKEYGEWRAAGYCGCCCSPLHHFLELLQDGASPELHVVPSQGSGSFRSQPVLCMHSLFKHASCTVCVDVMQQSRQRN